MSAPIRFTVKEIRPGFINAYTRIPFKYGKVTLTAVPLYHVEVTLENAQGKRARGYAGDCFPPKWFDKNPEKSYRQEIEEMLAVSLFAQKKALEVGKGTAFEIHQAIYQGTLEFGRSKSMVDLASGFGPTFTDRAIADAVGKLASTSFHETLQENLLGVDLGWYYPELTGLHPEAIVPIAPLDSVYIRHTVGLGDYLRDAEIPGDDLLNDGLPQSLEAGIRFYGLTYFKLKVFGDEKKDLERLSKIVDVIESNVQGEYRCTLDGNENFDKADAFLALVERLRADSRFDRFFESIVFIEQPIHRHEALSEASGDIVRELGKVKPVIIDESDQNPQSFLSALDLGYRGISHKNCKGFYKSLANLGLIKKRSTDAVPLFLSGEDLATLAIPALQSDLCAVASLGITHLERNGHHYFRGLRHLPQSDFQLAIQRHPDLYRVDGEEAFLNVRNGRLDIASLQCPGFGLGLELNMNAFTPAEEWKFESLGLDEG
ncbi:MAG: hypothetical protein O3B01_15100 [Planctomycetota bacterium]|nr:hypothetical protein [Planctomycetota bacterium]MDA1139900.1 hypothetical protein [Planctomycetota bacterium]